MTNFTTSYQPPPLNGGQPSRSTFLSGSSRKTTTGIPPSLLQKLAAVGVEAVLPNSDKLIGYTGSDRLKYRADIGTYAFHCLIVNIHIPVDEQEPKDGL